MPHALAAMTMFSVGLAVNELVLECCEQFPKVTNEGATPDYEKCIRISTLASMTNMIAPGALAILSPMVASIELDINTCAALLSGALVSSVQVAISTSYSCGAWVHSKTNISAVGMAPH